MTENEDNDERERYKVGSDADLYQRHELRIWHLMDGSWVVRTIGDPEDFETRALTMAEAVAWHIRREYQRWGSEDVDGPMPAGFFDVPMTVTTGTSNVAVVVANQQWPSKVERQRAAQEITDGETRSVMSSAVPEVRPVLLPHHELRPAVQAEQEARGESVAGLQGLGASESRPAAPDLIVSIELLLTGLADQQSMPDELWRVEWTRVRNVLKALLPAPPPRTP